MHTAPAHGSLLFVYGTLLTTGNHFGLYLASNCRFVIKGKLKGRLYDIGEYPGAIADTNYAGYVYGSIYRIDDNSVFTVLDEYEGISPGIKQPHEYIRTMLTVETANGPLPCWVYVYNWPVDNCTLISSGDYMAYTNK